ncbi:MAG: biotin/lipoyl-containing protein [Planctomycetia bacterium]|nr:biotin/lipoyl-containing protein [Planctomycetia bacterium]
MADYEAKLPDLGEDAGDEATLSFFYVEVGETIEKDAPLAQMVTDKAAFDVPSPVSGTIKSLAVKEEDVVEVGGLLAVIETEDGG